MMTPPTCLSQMLEIIATQTEAHAIAGTMPSLASLLALSRTLHVCAEAAADLEAAALPPVPVCALPPNVIAFPARRPA